MSGHSPNELLRAREAFAAARTLIVSSLTNSEGDRLEQVAASIRSGRIDGLAVAVVLSHLCADAIRLADPDPLPSALRAERDAETAALDARLALPDQGRT